MDFDLGKLTVVGWLVLLATAGIFLAGAYMVAVTPGGQEAVDASRGSRRMIAYVLMGVAAAFFVVCRLVLGKIGLPMFRG
ncbi:MAG TPA: hypothetical protein VMP01_22130 [Pirellulaceae bacterium]|nr:hypothetical protein [Pirellulaceae bacterium]